MADEPRRLLARLRESELGGDASAVTAFDELETLFGYLQALGCVGYHAHSHPLTPRPRPPARRTQRCAPDAPVLLLIV